MKKSSTILALFATAALVGLVGCASGLPVVDESALGIEMSDLSECDAPIYTWHGERDQLMTYWGPQQVSVDVTAALPMDWKEPGDGAWKVEAHNAEGKCLPFVGVIHTYTNEKGETQAVFVPPLDLNKASDCLYIIIEPGIEIEADKISVIRPAGYVYEIRDHTFRPFRVKIPLYPAKASELTPDPEPLPEVPAGTPIAIE